MALNLVIEDLEEDLSNGYVLHQLVTVLSQRTLAKAQKNPTSKFQKLQNLNTALDCLTKLEGVKLVNISAEDITAKNSKLDLGCTFSDAALFQCSSVILCVRQAFGTWPNGCAACFKLAIYDSK